MNIWRKYKMPKIKEDNKTFVAIAKALSMSPHTAELTFEMAMRKIRRYLLTNKQMRHNLRDGLEFLEECNHKSLKYSRDLPNKMED